MSTETGPPGAGPPSTGRADPTPPPGAPVPLRRNRDFMLLQSGQLLSNAGSQASSLAYPLLVLSLTHSAALAGVVSFARSAGLVAATLPAGLASDHWSRRRLMVGSDLLRLAALGLLGALILTGTVAYWVIPVVALVEGALTAVFGASSPGALRAVVPPGQLPAAAAASTGRNAAVRLIGPPLGGALYGVASSLPFLVDAGSYLASTASLLAMRTPFQGSRAEVDPVPLRRRLGEGFTFLWRQPFLRTSALLFGLGNFTTPALLLVLVVIGRRQGLSPALISGLVAAFGAAVLVGSLGASWAIRVLPAKTVLRLELGAALAGAAALVWPRPYVLAAALVPTGLVIPASDSVVHGYRLAMTPDRLIGRVESARSLLSLSISPLGPLLAGLLLEVSDRTALAGFLAVSVVAAVWVSLSPAIRSAPALESLVAA